jgi:hypothetical protein
VQLAYAPIQTLLFAFATPLAAHLATMNAHGMQRVVLKAGFGLTVLTSAYTSVVIFAGGPLSFLFAGKAQNEGAVIALGIAVVCVAPAVVVGAAMRARGLGRSVFLGQVFGLLPCIVTTPYLCLKAQAAGAASAQAIESAGVLLWTTLFYIRNRKVAPLRNANSHDRNEGRAGPVRRF